MKKRLRKKLHTKEFKEIGCAIKTSATTDTVLQTLDAIADLAVNNHMYFIGGGLGNIIFPHIEDADSEVPNKSAFLIESMITFPNLFPDFIVGYLVNAKGRKITESQKSTIREYISSLTVENDVKNYKCDLWN